MACSFAITRGHGGCTVLAVRGELDVSDGAELSSRLAAAASHGPWVIVDLADLDFIDCSSLGDLAGARARARLAGGDVLLAGPRGTVAWMLLLTGRDRVFSVFPSVGVAAFSAELAALGTRAAAAGAGESLAAATEGMVTAADTVTAPGRPRKWRWRWGPRPTADSTSQRPLAAADDSA